jgi:uncharacterized protein (DUF305 family)
VAGHAYGEAVLLPRWSRTAVVTLSATVTAAVALSACGSTAAEPDQADRTFLQDMIPHHERAIATARIGIARAHDPRVRAFARRIVAEQTPELEKLQARVAPTISRSALPPAPRWRRTGSVTAS